MSGTRRASEREGARRGRAMLGGLAALALLGGLAFATLGRDAHAHHPTPRAMDHAGHVVPAHHYEAHPRVAETYRMVAAVPHLVDGVFCYCMCAEHSGHYSLLDCFASDHGAHCDVCLSEATMVHEMSEQGDDLETIRTEIDHRFRS